MIFKSLVIQIIFFWPLILVAQSPTKNRAFKNGVIKKHTYAEDELTLAKMQSPIREKILSIQKLIEEKKKKLSKIPELPSKNIAHQSIDSLHIALEKLYKQLTTVQFNFIRTNPSSFFSLDGLSIILTQNAELPLYIDTITTLYNHLNKNVQKSTSGRHFKLMLFNVENSKIGSIAPAFTVNDINDHPISLSSFRNKEYVLLDFWASWCVPCRSDIPSLKEIYKKYNPKGLEIIGISKDDNASLWKKAIAEDNTENWKHILAPFAFEKNDSLVTNKYFVYGIPVKILINRNGVIIGRWSGSGEENLAELEKVLARYLD